MGAKMLFQVIGTALGLGIVHVMTGPDHLSALSTLSVGKPLKVAFGLGVRWGCGHSFGLLIVAIVFFAVGRSVNLDQMAYYADLFVGIFMVVLGAWYMLKAFRERMHYLQDRERKEAMELLHKQPPQSMAQPQRHGAEYDMEPVVVVADDGAVSPQPPSSNVAANGVAPDEEHIEMHIVADDDTSGSNESRSGPHSVGHRHKSVEPSKSSVSDSQSPSKLSGDSDGECEDELSPLLRRFGAHSLCFSEQHGLKRSGRHRDAANLGHDAVMAVAPRADAIPDDDIIIDGNAPLNPLFDGAAEATARSKCMTRSAAFVAGIFHGVAGPGGVLGVMVALKLNDWFLSSLYLLLFFVSSIVTMGLYAILYGLCTQRLTVCADNKRKCAFVLKFVSAVFSLIVGVLWISLTLAGTLDDVFE